MTESFWYCDNGGGGGGGVLFNGSNPPIENETQPNPNYEQNGIGYGAGGGSGSWNNIGLTTGGNGEAGIVYIEWD